MDSILIKADKLVNGERQEDYGDPKENHDRIAGMWFAYLNAKYGEGHFDVLPVDVVIMMQMVKIARLMENPDHEDSWTDIAGYAWVGNECTKAQ